MSQLAQLNIAHSVLKKEDPEMLDFVEALDPVNATADKSPGFIWRMKSEENPSVALHDFEQLGWLVNMSVWSSLADLKVFMTLPLHLSIMHRRAEWFEKGNEATMVLWWVEDGHRPEFEEAMERLAHLRTHGPGEFAFNFSRPFGRP